MREVTSGGGGYLSQSTRVLHFGLMDIETIDSLEVIWTGKRIRSKLRNIAPNQTLKIVQPYSDTVRVDICEGEEIFGKVWLANGEYRDTVTATNGADSSLYYQIYVNKKDEKDVNIDICKGEEFIGQTWDEPGEKVMNYVNVNGCDSVVTYNVSILQPYSSTIDTSICYGTYFQGKEYIESETFVREFKASNGCDSMITYNINILEAPNFQENFSVC